RDGRDAAVYSCYKVMRASETVAAAAAAAAAAPAAAPATDCCPPVTSFSSRRAHGACTHPTSTTASKNTSRKEGNTHTPSRDRSSAVSVRAESPSKSPLPTRFHVHRIHATVSAGPIICRHTDTQPPAPFPWIWSLAAVHP
ncbi:unnamed protein product, partial [Ectocarpus sp. 8 AP-2014]